ncbi:MAG: hypothetical protein JNL34_01325 [Anaerolineae bacterium]|nr:hypothetical protein [Anaerolineae bacterium]
MNTTLRKLSVNGLLVAGLSLGILGVAAGAADSPSGGPETVLDNLALYASRGQPIHYCRTGWQEGHPVTTMTNCTVTTDLTPFENRIRLLSSDEIIWVEFTSETLRMDELVRMWGRPQLEYDRAHRVSFRWNMPAAGLSGWMFWGDPREIPATTSLVLEVLDDSGGLSRD